MHPRAFLTIAFSIATATAIVGCSTTVKIEAAADPQSYRNCQANGTASIAGETFAKNKAGDVKTGAGSRVHLDRATSYSAAAFKALRAAGDLHAQTEAETFVFDPVMLSCRRSVTADSTGHFKFEQVIPGPYFLSAYIRWQVRGGWTGGWQIQLVRVKDGGQLEGVVVH